MAARLIHQDLLFDYYADHYGDLEVQFRRNKVTDEIHIMLTDEMAQKIFGFDSVEAMVRDQKINDLAIQFQKETGKKLFMPNISIDLNPN